jgi:hypothetical protein
MYGCLTVWLSFFEASAAVFGGETAVEAILAARSGLPKVTAAPLRPLMCLLFSWLAPSLQPVSMPASAPMTSSATPPFSTTIFVT